MPLALSSMLMNPHTEIKGFFLTKTHRKQCGELIVTRGSQANLVFAPGKFLVCANMVFTTTLYTVTPQSKN